MAECSLLETPATLTAQNRVKGFDHSQTRSNLQMNISMMDTYNLTWRLALVERGLAKPHLLDNYEFERIAIAQYLIDFDRRFSAYFTAKAETEASGQADFVKAFTLGNQFTRYCRLFIPN